MSDTITITLNGQSVETRADATIRDVATEQGIHIPTFCHDDRLKPFASCFLCVVSVEKARGLLPACSTRVAPGMVIHTDSAEVVKSRRMALDLLLSDHAGDCIAPCEATCPAGIDIQGYIAHIANGDFEAAVRLIKKRNPLPVVCGRICPHPCESQCRRGLVDEPVAINPLKRFSSEFDLTHGPFVPQAGAETNKRVAIVGGGPAGLSAAYFLRQAGHSVDIFEALPALGGMARYGIPRFRMPWDIMDREIRSILDLGVTVHYNQRLGQDFTIAGLKSQGFDAILLAIGAHKAKAMRVPNENVPGVMGGVDFLRKVVLNEPVELGKRVGVIGGGDTAMDCARVARRLGAEVTLLYRRTQAEMPALPVEQEETHEEGVEFRFLTAPVEVLLEKGRAKGLRVITMTLGEPDSSGRRRPVPLEGSEEDLPFDLIIPAIGQDPDLSCIDNETDKPEVTRWQTFVYDEKTQTTNIPGVFAAGDCAFGPDILIRAVGEGRRAAVAMDLYLNGADVKLIQPYVISRGRLEDLDMADFSPRYVHKKRALEFTHPPEKRLAGEGWAPINVGLDQVRAMAEATRCIECGCNARFDCDLRHYSTEYGASEKRLAGNKRDYLPDTRHPLIRIEADKCITCGSCVRICSEVRQIHALSFINRGFVTRIGPNFGDSLQETGCDACGMCIDVCPTGTLSANTGKEAGPWIWETMQTTCTNCSRGCGLAVHVAEGRVVKVGSIDGDPVNGAIICAEGRFRHRLLPGRMGEDDLNTLTSAQALLSGSGKVAVVVSAKLTVEESYAAARLARRLGAGFYYGSGLVIQDAEKPHGKIRGEANVALLTRLGAKPWQDSTPVDCLLLVNVWVDTSHLNGAKVIAMSVGSCGPYIHAELNLTMADPLMTEGAFLNRDGALTLLQNCLPAAKDRAGYWVLSALANEPGLADLQTLRRELVQEVPELAALLNSRGERVAPTGLSPQRVAVADDCREMAFWLATKTWASSAPQ
ncbi:MAG: FAD-dependent oxidoreductase [Magnetococcales bacterium]|nr:FAD-dependent oxidoreductase [Magnetococcales bacterium]